MPLDLTNRETLLATLPHGGKVAEIGVAEGCFSQKILELNEPSELWLIDAWTQQTVDVIGNDPANVIPAGQEAKYQQVVSRLGGDERVWIIKEFSVQAAKKFADCYLDGVYIDANHLQVVQDIEAWLPKVKVGGWIAGHDYTNAGDFISVKRDLDAYIASHGIDLIVTTGGDDIFEVNYPSWLFWRT